MNQSSDESDSGESEGESGHPTQAHSLADSPEDEGGNEELETDDRQAGTDEGTECGIRKPRERQKPVICLKVMIVMEEKVAMKWLQLLRQQLPRCQSSSEEEAELGV